MIDLSEPMFELYANPEMPRDYCVLLKDDRVIYSGPIRHCPGAAAGMELHLHPGDFERFEAHMKKQLN